MSYGPNNFTSPLNFPSWWDSCYISLMVGCMRTFSLVLVLRLFIPRHPINLFIGKSKSTRKPRKIRLIIICAFKFCNLDISTIQLNLKMFNKKRDFDLKRYFLWHLTVRIIHFKLLYQNFTVSYFYILALNNFL